MVFFIPGTSDRCFFFSYYLPKEKKLRNKNIKTQQLKCFEWANLMLKIKISRDGKSFFKSQNPLLKSSELVYY